jgi:hypothetical protein
MNFEKRRRSILGILGFTAGWLVATAAAAQATTAAPAPAAHKAATSTPASSAASSPGGPTSHKGSPYSASARLTPKAETYYVAAWGVDRLKVSSTSSGNLIRFSYRVSDPARARQLGDKKATPYLLGQKSHALLQVPVMDKVGQLRQTATAQAGQEFWMVFSNKGHLIRPGDRVNVLIGSFHAEGLVVEGS